jgi:hypothetical protein
VRKAASHGSTNGGKAKEDTESIVTVVLYLRYKCSGKFPLESNTFRDACHYVGRESISANLLKWIINNNSTRISIANNLSSGQD